MFNACQQEVNLAYTQKEKRAFKDFTPATLTDSSDHKHH